MQFDMINGMYRVHQEDPNTQDLLYPGAIPANPQDMNLSEILSLVAGLITALQGAEDKLQKLMDSENKLEGLIEASFLDPSLKEALKKQIDALIDRQVKLQQSLKSLIGMAEGIESSGCQITSTSNPLESLIQMSSTDLKKDQELAKEAKALLNEIGNVIFSHTINVAIATGNPIPDYVQTSIEGFQKTDDATDAKLDQRLQSLLKTLEEEAKKLTQAIDHHLQTEPSKTPLNPSSHPTHSTQK